jgi:hypothetical protein
MEQVILHNGNNNYKIRHMNKQRLEKEGWLPMSIDCSPKVLQVLTANGIKKNN